MQNSGTLDFRLLLLGDGRFCPTVRCTETFRYFDAAGLEEQCQKVVVAYPPELLERALGYLSVVSGHRWRETL
jgi:hypothetical protein